MPCLCKSCLVVVAEKCINFAGRELFMIDHSLDDSDVKFLEEGTDVVSSLMLVCHY